MNALFFIFLTLILVVVQTVILPSFSWFEQCFDLLITDVLFLSLISSHTSMIFAIIVIGIIMDSLSGVPFFYHIFSYLWIYIIVYIVKQLLFHGSVVFILIISLVAVFIQHGLLLYAIFVQEGTSVIWAIDSGSLVKQAFWGFLVIPPGIWLINILWKIWIRFTRYLNNQLFKDTEGHIGSV